MSSTRPLPLEAVLIRSLQLIQPFGLSTALVRNWSSLFLNGILRICDCRFVSRHLPPHSTATLAALPAMSAHPIRSIPIADFEPRKSSVISVVDDLNEVHERDAVASMRYPDERAFGEGAERDTRGAYAPRSENLFEQRPQILKHGVFFVRARAIGDKEFLAQVQCFSFHCSGTTPVPYRSQESISVPLIFFRVPCVISRSQNELIERHFRIPVELPHGIGDQPVLCEHDQIVGVHAIV
jgi:hypothetical protein